MHPRTPVTDPPRLPGGGRHARFGGGCVWSKPLGYLEFLGLIERSVRGADRFRRRAGRNDRPGRTVPHLAFRNRTAGHGERRDQPDRSARRPLASSRHGTPSRPRRRPPGAVRDSGTGGRRSASSTFCSGMSVARRSSRRSIDCRRRWWRGLAKWPRTCRKPAGPSRPSASPGVISPCEVHSQDEAVGSIPVSALCANPGVE